MTMTCKAPMGNKNRHTEQPQEKCGMYPEIDRERLFQAVRQSGEAIIITDSEGVIEYANPTFERISGYSLHEAIGQKTEILRSGYHDDDFYGDLWQTISSAKPWQLPKEMKERLICCSPMSLCRK